jgi:hypothetical protein
MNTHNIKYEGLDLEVTGEYDSADETTGYKGGFSWMTIEVDGTDISWMLKDEIVEQIVELVTNENY